MKKIIALVLVMMFAVCALTACSKKTTDTAKQATEQAAEEVKETVEETTETVEEAAEEAVEEVK